MMFRKAGRQRGIAIVEFAFVMPILFVALFATFEFGMAFYRKTALSSAVGAGARAGIVATTPRKTEQEIIAVVSSYLSSIGWDVTNLTTTAPGAGGAQGADLTVTSTYPTSFLLLSRFPYGGITVDGSGNVSLRASVTMKME